MAWQRPRDGGFDAKNRFAYKRAVVTEFYNNPVHAKTPNPGTRVKSITENEKDHIIATLKACNWKVYGPGGGAELLRINVSTLNSRIKKLGIEKLRPG